MHRCDVARDILYTLLGNSLRTQASIHHIDCTFYFRDLACQKARNWSLFSTSSSWKCSKLELWKGSKKGTFEMSRTHAMHLRQMKSATKARFLPSFYWDPESWCHWFIFSLSAFYMGKVIIYLQNIKFKLCVQMHFESAPLSKQHVSWILVRIWTRFWKHFQSNCWVSHLQHAHIEVEL